jgi:hypothetical protein
MKGPDGRGLQTKEETMSTFTTISDLQRLTDRELDILHLAVTQGSPDMPKARQSAARPRQRWP